MSVVRTCLAVTATGILLVGSVSGATAEGDIAAAEPLPQRLLFDRSPRGLGYSFGLGPDDAAFLQRIAWEAVTDWRAGIPAAD